MQPQVFEIAPAASKGMWALFLLAGVVVLFVVGLLAAAAWGSRQARFEVSSEGLRLHGDLYGRLISLPSLQPAGTRRVDFAATPTLEPSARTMGTGLPGYQAGWFHLRSGERALLYLTDRKRAVYVPTNDGYAVLLSPADPDAFVSAVRGLAAAKP
ncbi:MAG: PH domain-containing protein [Gemmatimonadaceae bacterium]